MNPLYLILVANLIGLIWAIRSWRKGIREKWLNELRNSGAELIGACEKLYAANMHKDNSLIPIAKAEFIAKEAKVLLLFAHNEAEKNDFSNKIESLRDASEKVDVERYRIEIALFSELVAKRVLKEWEYVKAYI